MESLSKYYYNPTTVKDAISSLSITHPKFNPVKESPKRLAAPKYTGPTYDTRFKLGLTIKSTELHTSDEAWQLFKGLAHNGYMLAGHNLQINLTNIDHIVKKFYPGTMVIQDVREWEGKTAGRGFDQRERFTNERILQHLYDIFKVTIIKDSHQETEYHSSHCNNMGIHAWISYYNLGLVNYLAPYTRFENLIRTYHTVNKDVVPIFLQEKDRKGCLLSGAISSAYPLRTRLIKEIASLIETTYLPHPGYKRTKCHTPEFLEMLNNFKVAICTSSMYKYTLRKLIEATACGCIIITDLPVDEKLPYIDDNLVRVSPRISTNSVKCIVQDLIEKYDEERQRHYANLAKEHYDYREVTKKLAEDIEKMRLNYNRE